MAGNKSVSMAFFCILPFPASLVPVGDGGGGRGGGETLSSKHSKVGAGSYPLPSPGPQTN